METGSLEATVIDCGGTMDLGEMLRVFGKRWYVAFPAFLVAVALPAAAYEGIAAKYESQSTLCLLNSKQASDTTPHLGNPFLDFDSSLTPTADFLARRLSSSQTGVDLAPKGVTEALTAKLADNATGPFVTLTATGTDQAHVLATMQIFDDYAEQQLEAMQVASTPNLNPDTLIRSVVIVPPQTPVAQSKSKIEEVAGIGAFSMGLAFLTVFGVENVATRRSAKRVTAVSEGRATMRVRNRAGGPDPVESDEPEESVESESLESESFEPESFDSGSSFDSIRSFKSGSSFDSHDPFDSDDSFKAVDPFKSTASLKSADSDEPRDSAESLDEPASGDHDAHWYPNLERIDFDDLAVADREAGKS